MIAIKGVEVGDLVRCTVSFALPSKRLVLFNFPTDENGKLPLVTAVGFGSALENVASLGEIASLK